VENINELLETLHLEKNIKLEDIPNVDLYVDQVVQLFENTYADTTRTDDEKVLTKTMINNYAKGKLFIPIKNKEYSKEQDNFCITCLIRMNHHLIRSHL